MKVVFFGISTRKIAAIRYRVIKFADLLARDGHQTVVCLPSSVELFERLWTRGNRFTKGLWVLYVGARRILQLRHIFGADVIIFRGAVAPCGFGPPIFERFIRLFNRHMVYDIDDAVWNRQPYTTSPFYGLTDFNWIWKMCRICPHGIVGNRYLQEECAKHGSESTIVPTCIDMGIHTGKAYPPADPDRPVVLGWTGTKGNLRYLEVCADAIQRLAKKYPIVLSVASGEKYHMDGVEVINHDWEEAHEIDYLKEADVGLMPLIDTPYTRGKCAFKALQYMGVGTPCVISPVGMNADIIEEGVDGFVATDSDEWYDRLERLICDAQLRRKMGEAARRKVIERYSFEAYYPRFKELVEEIARKGA